MTPEDLGGTGRCHSTDKQGPLEDVRRRLSRRDRERHMSPSCDCHSCTFQAESEPQENSLAADAATCTQAAVRAIS